MADGFAPKDRICMICGHHLTHGYWYRPIADYATPLPTQYWCWDHGTDPPRPTPQET